MAQRKSTLLDTQIVYCGDCLNQLQKLPDASIDLIYIDPPFNSNRNYKAFWGETKEKQAFVDRYASTQEYIKFMRPRCIELARVLKKTGSFYYHCDWHASHYVKVMLDRILGENNFRSEIIWRRAFSKSFASTSFPNNHDTIFYYGAGGHVTFNRPYVPYDPANLDKKTRNQYCHRTPDGRIYCLDNLTNSNPDRPNLKYEFMGVTKVWCWTQKRMKDAYEQGIIIQTKPGSVPRLMRFLDEQKGRPIGTVWIDIPPISSHASERLGYPTQKPLALLERIVAVSSNTNDIVLDAFCGSGTTLIAAEKLKRQWIGIDVSPIACGVMAKRLRDVCKLREDEDSWHAGRGFVVRDLPLAQEDHV